MSHNPYKKLEDTGVRGAVIGHYTNYENVDRTQQFWNEQGAWSEATFGPTSERGPLGALKHLEKEAKEAQAEATIVMESGVGNESSAYPKLKEELADCLFLTIDAARRAGMTLDTLLDEAFRKLEINKQRKWQRPTDAR